MKWDSRRKKVNADLTAQEKDCAQEFMEKY